MQNVNISLPDVSTGIIEGTMGGKAKPRIETQIPRRKKAGPPVEMRSEWEAQQGVRTTGLKMSADAMAPGKPDAAKRSKSSPS